MIIGVGRCEMVGQAGWLLGQELMLSLEAEFLLQEMSVLDLQDFQVIG